MELIFQFIFQFSIFTSKESSILCLIFSYFCTVFRKSGNVMRQELSFNHIWKECLSFKDLQIIRKKADTVLISFYSSSTTQNVKWYCNAFGTWSSPRATSSNQFRKQGSNFISLNALIFPLEFDVLFFEFSPAEFSDCNYEINDRKQPLTS